MKSYLCILLGSSKIECEYEFLTKLGFSHNNNNNPSYFLFNIENLYCKSWYKLGIGHNNNSYAKINLLTNAREYWLNGTLLSKEDWYKKRKKFL